MEISFETFFIQFFFYFSGFPTTCLCGLREWMYTSTEHRRVNRMRISATHIPSIWPNSFSPFHTLLLQNKLEWETHHLQRKLFPTFFSSDEKTQLKRHESSSLLFSFPHLKCSFNDELLENELEGDDELNEQWKHEKLSKSTRHTTRWRNVVVC